MRVHREPVRAIVLAQKLVLGPVRDEVVFHAWGKKTPEEWASRAQSSDLLGGVRCRLEHLRASRDATGPRLQPDGAAMMRRVVRANLRELLARGVLPREVLE